MRMSFRKFFYPYFSRMYTPLNEMYTPQSGLLSIFVIWKNRFDLYKIV